MIGRSLPVLLVVSIGRRVRSASLSSIGVTVMSDTTRHEPEVFARAVEPHTWLEGVETPAESALRAEVREFAWTHLESKRNAIDDARRCNTYMPMLAERGYLGTLVAPEHGGAGLGLGASVVIAQELGGVVPSLAAMRAVCGNFVAKPLEEFGSPMQIKEFLAPLMTGEWTTALAISEPEAGSDVSRLATSAVRDGDGWVLNGCKRHISGAAESQFMLVYAVTAPDASPSGRFTAFIVPTDTPGVDASDEEPTMGVRGLSHARVRFDNVRVDDALRLGGVGEALRILFFGLAAERIDISARALGCATRAFEEARGYAAHREQFGKPIRSFQAVSHKIADMRTRIDAGRLLVIRAARLYDQVLASEGPERASELCNAESSIAKLFCAEQGFWVCDQAMQVFGGRGYEHGSVVEVMFRDARVFRFGGGTDEIQRHIIQRDEFARRSAVRD
jgi:alkylation response protein AidB-like acyl-CoA dehydrogenase